ncbi:MAG TPA: SUMF1/EgtB/PvdO family nonheme iron enzyme [Chthoniobacteraceae bacterium]|nr:SUMF1/EgtB/PvdO family nonheme iron enzyme [Chthoniobacteraceae bacterium]
MKILVVDKQEELRVPADILWNTQGNEVLFASTGQQALDLVEGKQVDILISEVFMEPMNGFTLRNKMENRHPGIKTIFLTGHDLGPYAEHTAGYEVVSKPATAQTLLSAITRALGFAVKEEAPAAPAPVAQQPPVPEVAAPAPQPPAPVSTPVAVPRVTATPHGTPIATPRAVPAAVPRISAQPAQPVVTPHAVPAARPPQPVATPRAVPAARPPQPVAAPAAHPAAAPSARPVPTARPAIPSSPQAVPVPTARPASPTPRAVPAATPPNSAPQPSPGIAAHPAASTPHPVATPRLAAVPKAAIPVAVPKPGAPNATPAATPRAIPRATVAGQPRIPVAVPAAPKSPEPPDPLIGAALGAYHIERRLGAGKWGAVYLATQTSVNRPVAMEVLSATAAADEQMRQDFVATARAKAAVQHSHILSVYEADQSGGYYFYTHEFVEGATLDQLRARDEGLTEPIALQTIKFVGQGLAYLHQSRIGHPIPEASDIYLGVDGMPYLSNIALGSAEMPGVQDEIRALSAIICAMLPGGQARDQGLRALLMRMAQPTQSGFQSWIALFQAIQAIEPKVIPADAFKLSAQDQAAIRAVEEARKRQKLQVMMSIAVLFVFIWVVIIALWYEFMRPKMHDYSNEMIKIPAGTFIYQDGQKITLPDFYIDKYEVTLAEYAKFLDFLKKDPHPAEFDSPQQPDGLQHTPPNWDIMWGRASSSLPNVHNYRGQPLTVDCPIFNVNFYDAYAYAKWKGRRLPTEQEWEKAARGPVGNAYPWGNDWDPKKLNAGADYQANPEPGYKPAVDGFCWWAPVTAFPDDRSPYGVIDMGGNVSEWTNSWDETKAYPVIRGGNFKSTPAQALATAAIRDAGPLTTSETLGFRTASDKPPAK